VADVFDAVVVGCGPSGSASARILAQAGAKVAMLDQCAFPRPKLCGGLITWKSIQALSHIFDENIDSLKEKGIINNSSQKYAIYYRDNLLHTDAVSYPFHFVDRKDLDLELVRKAQAAGAVLMTGDKVVKISAAEGWVCTASGKKIQGRYILGADGANSLIRRSIPLDRKAWRRNLASTIEISIPVERFPFAPDHPALYIGYIDAGYCWVFPHLNNIVIGVCGLNRSNGNFRQIFIEFLRSLGLAERKDLAFKAHPLPYGNFLKEPCFQKVLLCGDAAGFVEPLLGEGIFYAMTTGRYAAEAILLGKDSYKKVEKLYMERLKKNIYPELIYSNVLRWLLLLNLRYFSRLSFKLFFRTHTQHLAELVHGMRSYRWFRKKEWD
jgi:geranylgeranyl reductase family protein